MTTIGVVVNPIAGMGGRVGLKGTDGVEQEARRRGAEPQASLRAVQALQNLDPCIKIMTCGGDMGIHDILNVGDIVYKPGTTTTSYDTMEACRRFIKAGVDCIVFCGGDGTARDVYAAVRTSMPILGIPAGVKMYSSVFTRTPGAVAPLLAQFSRGQATVAEGEIMDVKEGAFRENRVEITLFGHALTLCEPLLMQPAKHMMVSKNEDNQKLAIAAFLAPLLASGIAILGGGTTTAAIAQQMGVEKTLLGIDVLRNGELIVPDANEEDILNHLNGEAARVVVSPMGHQGCFLGRANQQISPSVIAKVGLENILLVATPHKLLQTPWLFVDTGSSEMDQHLAGWHQVVVGYMLAARRKVIAI